MSVSLPDGYSECDRGNTVLLRDTDCGVAFLGYFDVPDDSEGKRRRLEVTTAPGNYPTCYIQLLDVDGSRDEHLARHIAEKVQEGWSVRKYNLDTPLPIIEEENDEEEEEDDQDV